MLPIYEKNALITIPIEEEITVDVLSDWESPPQTADAAPIVLDAYLKRIRPQLSTGTNTQRGVDEATEQYIGFIWPPKKLPTTFGNRQMCSVQFTDGSQRSGEAEVTRRVVSAKSLLQEMNDNGDRIEVRFSAQLRGVA